MKTFFSYTSSFAILFALTLPFSNSAQNNCGGNEVLSIQKNNTPNFDKLQERNNLAIKNYIEKNYGPSSANRTATSATYIIPVVFHVVHPTGQAYGNGANISYNQIKSQVDALNAAYSKSYPTYNGQTHPAYAQNTNIQFCLASVAMPSSVSFYNGPSGIEKGVMRYADNTLTNHQITNASATALLGLTHPTANHFPFNNYLNIWLVSSINGASGVMGYAPLPLMGSYPLDGVIMRADIIGDNSTGNTFTLGFGLDQGKVLSHEIGHYLNLMHIFEGGCAGKNIAGSATDACDLNGDMICDIEPCTTQNYNCNNPIPNTCTANYTINTTTADMIESYMSYADDDCMNTFTMNQSQRMWATLNTSRANLWSIANQAATGIIGVGGCLAPTLLSTVKFTPGSACTGSTVVVSNPTTGNTAISWNWSLPGANITTATTSSISISYSVPGLYWAKLSVSDGTITLNDSALIAVTNCSLDPTKLNQANWYFGKNIALAFNTGAAVSQTPSAINSDEQAASISDSLGNLLFYTDGDLVWNKNHVQMTNLGGLLRGFIYPAKSASQGALIVPFPFDKKKYYLFSGTQQPVNSGDSTKQLKYSVIDMNLNGGLGEISVINQTMPGQYFLSTEGLTSVPHCNGYDYWVIIRTAKTSGYIDKLAAYLITANGISNPIFSNAGYSIPYNTADGNEYLSSIEASPDSKLVSVTCNISIANGKRFYMYKFNNSTGTFTALNNYLVGPSGVGFLLGQQFSPDSKKLYLDNDFDIYQVDLTVPASPVITQIGTQNYGYGGFEFQTGPDNKIYCSQYNQNKLAVISFPNNLGAACSLSLNAVNLITGQQSKASLPNFIDANKPPGISFSFISTALNCTTNKFTVDSCWNFYTAHWNFGDGNIGTGLNINHTYTASGTYSVTLVLSIGGFSFNPISQNVTIIPSIPVISGPAILCKGSTFLNTYGVNNVAGATYSWTAGNSSVSGPSNLSSVNLLTSLTGIATLTVHVTNGLCLATATKTILIDTVPALTLSSNPAIVCLGNNATLNGTPSGGTYSGINVTGTTFNGTTAGVNQVHYNYTNANGCSNNITLPITVASCAGIKENKNTNESISIFPSPASEKLFVSSSDGYINSVTLINAFGQLIYKASPNRSYFETIPVNEFASGVYYIIIKTDNNTVTKKIVKD